MRRNAGQRVRSRTVKKPENTVENITREPSRLAKLEVFIGYALGGFRGRFLFPRYLAQFIPHTTCGNSNEICLRHPDGKEGVGMTIGITREATSPVRPYVLEELAHYEKQIQKYETAS
jgi:hypothetical protein